MANHMQGPVFAHPTKVSILETLGENIILYRSQVHSPKSPLTAAQIVQQKVQQRTEIFWAGFLPRIHE